MYSFPEVITYRTVQIKKVGSLRTLPVPETKTMPQSLCVLLLVKLEVLFKLLPILFPYMLQVPFPLFKQ